ncbi:MAG: PKD domain-containing protein, partial [Gemmatimonadota bacterium]|nr:PKD domain-containing protein [Gemmatimonadota bacterium]
NITETNVTVDVCYEARGPFRCVSIARFVGQIGISPGSFSDGGDSGSLIVRSSDKSPVGLLYAGSTSRTLANPISPVLSRFGVAIETNMASCAGGGTPTNQPPAPDFTFTTNLLTASFTDASSDSDGAVVSWNWDFGDGQGSSVQNPSHTYAANGTYTVTLTATDDDGDSDSISKSVTVNDGSGYSLQATGFKLRGRHSVDLTWSGASTAEVDITRNGTLIATTANDGAYTDTTDTRGSATYTYQVCDAGTSTCSNEATVIF